MVKSCDFRFMQCPSVYL